MRFKILAINPGSTSTKIALYDGGEVLFEQTLRHSVEEIAKYQSVYEQLDWRRGLIMDVIEEQQLDVKELDAVIGRGGIINPVEAGVYEVNSAMCRDLKHARKEHASNLGALIADEIANLAGVKAYIADPVVVDEMDDLAKVGGLPQTPRQSLFHALNQKATARLYCDDNGKDYDKSRLIVAHLGGGISVATHKNGRVVDTNNALDGCGPFSPERAGRIEPGELVNIIYSGKYTKSEIDKMVLGQGGLIAHLGESYVSKIIEKIEGGDKHAKLIIDAMCYNISKSIGAMATVLKGDVDAIIITGGVAYNKYITDVISASCSFIAPIAIYAGENELQTLELNARLVLEGVVIPKEYK